MYTHTKLAAPLSIVYHFCLKELSGTGRKHTYTVARVKPQWDEMGGAYIEVCTQGLQTSISITNTLSRLHLYQVSLSIVHHFCLKENSGTGLMQLHTKPRVLTKPTNVARVKQWDEMKCACIYKSVHPRTLNQHIYYTH